MLGMLKNYCMVPKGAKYCTASQPTSDCSALATCHCSSARCPGTRIILSLMLESICNALMAQYATVCTGLLRIDLPNKCDCARLPACVLPIFVHMPA